MKILITGTPGSGKTSLVEYASNLGNYFFIDADEYPDLCEWRSFSDGKFFDKVDLDDLEKDDQWYKDYGWFWNEQIIKKIICSDKDVILCGSSENVTDFYNDFDAVIILIKTEKQLLSNLQSPNRTNPFGKTAKQREGFMKWQIHLVDRTKTAELSSRIFLLEGNDISKIYDDVKEIISKIVRG